MNRSPKKDYPRSDKVNELFQRELSNLLVNKVQDPRLKLVTISSVETTRDFSLSKVYVTFFKTDDVNQKEVLKVLNKAAGFFRSEIAKKVNLKKLPKIMFVYDPSLDEGNKIDAILDSLHNTDEGDRESSKSAKEELDSDNSNIIDNE